MNLPSPFSALGLDPYSPVNDSKPIVVNQQRIKIPWVGRTCRTLSLQVDPKHFSSEIQVPRPRRTSTFSMSATSLWLQPAAKIIYNIFEGKLLSSPRAESARAVTGKRCPHSGRGEDFLSRQPDFFTETAVTPERKVEKSFPRWEINRHDKG